MKRSISTPALVTLVFLTMLFGVSTVWLAYDRLVCKLALELVVRQWVLCEQGVPYSPEPDKSEGIEL
jgi:hypothetical protein